MDDDVVVGGGAGGGGGGGFDGEEVELEFILPLTSVSSSATLELYESERGMAAGGKRRGRGRGK